MSPKPGGNSRLLAIELLRGVLDERASLGETGAAEGGFDARDAAFARHLAYGVLRWFSALEWLAARLLNRPLKKRDQDIHFLVLIGIFQLWKDRSPQHAAVHANAEAARHAGKSWAVGLINALLRRFQREQDELLAALDARDQRFAHPGWLLDEVRQDWPGRWRDILEANNLQAPMWLRINRQRTGMASYRAMLGEAGLESRAVEARPDALQVLPAVAVNQLPGFHDGLVSVQDAAAQWAADLLDPAPGEVILDACAAPGGKTCHLLERAPGIVLTALDKQAARTGLIRENLQRLGLDCTLKTGDATEPDAWWDGQPFDKILLDAPCSATGVIRRHPEIKWLRSPEQVQLAVQLQTTLLDQLWPLLNAGGILVYATCSVLRRENTKQIHEFLSRHTNAQCIGPRSEDPPGCQLLPGMAGMDGFFYAVLRKSA